MTRESESAMHTLFSRLTTGLFVLGVAGGTAVYAAPLPCQTSSLQSYVASGPCSVGNLVFSSFNVIANPSGAPALGAENITVTPTSGEYTQSLDFRFQTTAIGSPFGSSFEQIFTYLVNPLGTFTNAGISLSGSQATDDGVVLSNQFLCQGGTLSGDGSSCQGAGSFFNQAVVAIDPDDPTLLMSSLSLDSNGAVLFVRNEIAVDGGQAGSASGGTLTNSFTAVPEPAGMTGVGTLLVAGLAYYRRRRLGQ